MSTSTDSAGPADPPSPNQATFIGIPRELRLRIYDYLRHSPIEYQVLKGFNDDFTNGGFSAKPIRAEDQHLYLPWLNVALTCRPLAHEIQSSLISSPASATAGEDAERRGESADHDRTYTLSMELIRQGQVGQVTWTTIPCAPSDVKTLVVTCNADSKTRFWGDGGPMGIVRSLYQTFNLFLHCGPNFNATRPLPARIRLQELVVVMAVAERKNRQDGEEMSWSHPYRSMKSILWTLEGTGLLSGYVEKLRIVGEGDRVQDKLVVRQGGVVQDELVVQQGVVGRVPQRWAGYGFQWGLGCSACGRSDCEG